MKLTNTEDRQRRSNIQIIRVTEKENWSKGAEQIPKNIIKIFSAFQKNWKGILFNINQQQDIFQKNVWN